MKKRVVGKRRSRHKPKNFFKKNLIWIIVIAVLIVILGTASFLFFLGKDLFFQRGPYSDVNFHKLPMEEAKLSILEVNRNITYYDFESEINLNMSFNEGVGDLFKGLGGNSTNNSGPFKAGMDFITNGYYDKKNKRMESKGTISFYNLTDERAKKINQSEYGLEVLDNKTYIINEDEKKEIPMDDSLWGSQDILRSSLIFVNSSDIEFLEDEGDYYVLKIKPNSQAFAYAMPSIPGQETVSRMNINEDNGSLENISFKIWVNKKSLLIEKSRMFYDITILFFRIQMSADYKISNVSFSNEVAYSDKDLAVEFPKPVSKPLSEPVCAPKACSQLGYECGDHSDGCGKIINCGSCPSKEKCSSGKCTCAPETCETLDMECGSSSDGCGGKINCGICPLGKTCSVGTCIVSCTPKTCSSLDYECGSHSNGCGGTLNCGDCSSGESCSSGNCVADCVPQNCSILGYECGNHQDNCDKEIECGSCSPDKSCSSEGKCIIACSPKTCENYSGECGSSLDDGCGGTIDCSNNCGEGKTCSSGNCVPLCTPKTCMDYAEQCGSSLDDGCGGTIDCSNNCGEGKTCNNGSCASLSNLNFWKHISDFFKRFF